MQPIVFRGFGKINDLIRNFISTDGRSDAPGLSSDSSGTESLSWIANSMDWDYESDETDPETIFSRPKGSVDTTGLVGHNNKDTISEVL